MMPKSTNYLFKLDILILSCLREKDCYGYELTKLISQLSNNLIVPKTGTMYPVLYELLENKYISSYEKYVKTKVRVYYHIEDSGKNRLEELINEYETLIKAINHIVYRRENNND